MIEHEKIAALKHWLSTDPGDYARHWQQQQINEWLGNVFGYHAIQIGMPHWDLLANNRILHKWYTHGQDHTETAPNQAQLLLCEVEHLPFASESIDLLVLPHVLETSSDPHQVLREVQRVLVPEGQVVLSGFNPWSLWGGRDRLPGLECVLPIEPQYQISPWRTADWLEVLSFEVTEEVTGCFRPLCLSERWLQRWAFMDKLGAKWWSMLGALYAVKATKRVTNMTPLGMDWSKKSTVKAAARHAAASQTTSTSSSSSSSSSSSTKKL